MPSCSAVSRMRKYSSEPFGPTVELLMGKTGTTYRALAGTTRLSAGYLNHLVHGSRPVPDDGVLERIAAALKVEPDHFREYRLRALIDHLEHAPEAVDRLYLRIAAQPR